MQNYQNGNMAAFDQLYRRHKDPLWRFFLRAGQNEATAAELFQETWAAVIKSRARYEARAKFTTWLYHLAHSKLMDQLRQRRLGTESLDSLDAAAEPVAPEQERPERKAESVSLARRILQGLAVLPLEQREAFLLKEEGGLSLEEIAQTTGVGRETVKSRLRYALVKLREELADVYP